MSGSYWKQTLLNRLGAAELLRLLALVFLLVFASVLVLHLFLPDRHPPGTLLRHAVQIAAAYLFWFALLTLVLAAALHRGWLRVLRVWHVWASSALCYLLGFFAASFDDALTVALHHDVTEGRALFHFLRLLPVWLAVTWVFVEVHLGRSRRAEIERLLALDADLGAAHPAPHEPQPRVVLEQGRTRLDVAADAVSHVSVDDHYCYLHYREGEAARKLAVGLPLKSLLAQLPEPFLQIHRSHVVNVGAVTGLERRGRGCWVKVATAAQPVWLPVSRQRLDEVLPRLTVESAARGRAPD